MKPLFKYICIFFVFFLSFFNATAQTDKKKIQILNENGEKLNAGSEGCYVYFNKNNRVIKRKIERGETILLSCSAAIAAIIKAENEYSRFEISVYNNEGDIIRKIHNDSIIASGGLIFADDGRFAYFKPTYIDEIGSAPVQLTFYSKRGKKIKSVDELFSINMISTFSKSGKFAMFLMADPQDIVNGKLIIYDSNLNVAGIYIFENFHYKNLWVTKYPIKFDENDNVIISTYDLIEYEDTSKNELIRFRAFIDSNGNFIKREEGWDNE
jgi:hypothetical protein